MSWTGISLITFVVILSGLLSYYGDVLGRKLGKKRLTVGRIRPRHTAAMMTALFGMIGSGTAIAILMLFAQPVRVMLVEGDRLRGELAKLEKDLNKNQQELSTTQSVLKKTSSEVTSEKNKVLAEQTKLAIERKNVSALRDLTSQLKIQAQKSRSEVAQVRKQLTSLRPQFVKLQAEFKTINDQKSTAVKYYMEVSKKNLELDNQLQVSGKQLEANKKQIEELNGTIKDLQNKLFTQSTEANKQLKALQEEVGEAQKKVQAANTDLELANREYTQLKAGIEQLLSVATAASRTQPLIYSRGDELARVTTRSKLNATEARSLLLAALENSSQEAESKGAKASTPNSEAAVLPPLRDDKGVTIPAEKQMESIIDRMVGKNEEQVILAYAFFNAFKGEPVPLSIVLRPNPVVYRAGQVVMETRIDGQLPEDQILDAISKFAQNQLSPKAIRDGLIPAIGAKEPLGEISPDAILSLVSEIKSVNRTIRVQFVASQDTKAADRLKLRFVLK